MSRTPRKPLGAALREARLALSLTQTELAARAGLAPNHVARLENGEKASPRFTTVARLAAVLGLSLDELAAGSSRSAGGLTAEGGGDARTAGLASTLRRVQRAIATSARELEVALDGFEGSSSRPRAARSARRRRGKP